MSETTPKIEPLGLRHYFFLIWKWIWLLVLFTGLAAVTAFIASRLMTPVYQAKTQLLINETSNPSINDYTAILMSERQVRTYSVMLTNRLLLEAVIADLDLNMTVQDLADTVQVELIRDTRLIVITIENPDPNRAANIANAIATRFIEQLQTIENSANSGVIHLEPATAPKSPARPQVLMNTILAAIAGLALSLGVVFLIEALDDTIHTPEDVSRYLGLPIFGVIPSHVIETGKPITIAEPRSPVSDAYRNLRANIHFASVDRPLKTLLITSCMPGEGKSTLAANLGVVLAQSDLKTAIVDADFRRPHVHKNMGLPNRRGLSDLLAEQPVLLKDKLQQTEIESLKVLTSGSLPPNPTELLGSEKIFQILQLLGDQADMLVIDTPPMLVVADAAVIASRLDGVLMVIKPGATRITAARQSIEQLRRAKANLLGVVLNDINIKRDGYYGGYYHSYQYRYGGETPTKGFLSRWIKRIKA